MITVKDYLARLQLADAPPADLQGLKMLHERHLLCIPFENLDICQGRPIELDFEPVLSKLVENHRGGFCYELNGAFAWLLGELGFSVTLLESRVCCADGSQGVPFDHLALRVDLDEPWLVDVGFGRGFFHPLRWQERDEVRQRASIWRLDEDNEGHLWLREMNRRTMSFEPVYEVLPQARELSDFQPGCDYHQSSENSPFTQGLIASIAAPDGRITLQKRVLATIRNGRREEVRLEDEGALLKELKRYFGLTPADAEGLWRATA